MVKCIAIEAICAEYDTATEKFGRIISPHEGLAIIQEEFEELKVEIYKNSQMRNTELMKYEAKQLAAMALRFMVDIC